MVQILTSLYVDDRWWLLMVLNPYKTSITTNKQYVAIDQHYKSLQVGYYLPMKQPKSTVPYNGSVIFPSIVVFHFDITKEYIYIYRIYTSLTNQQYGILMVMDQILTSMPWHRQGLSWSFWWSHCRRARRTRRTVPRHRGVREMRWVHQGKWWFHRRNFKVYSGNRNSWFNADLWKLNEFTWFTRIYGNITIAMGFIIKDNGVNPSTIRKRGLLG